MKLKIPWKKLGDLLTWIMVIYLGLRLASSYWTDQKLAGEPAQSFSTPLISGASFDLAAQSRPLVLVFWATWCGPCDVELSRINQMIRDREIENQSVLAISVQEDAKIVSEAVRVRDYLFPVGLDLKGTIAESYQVSGTPTVLFLDREKNVAWRTTGLSPTLGFRIRGFLKSQSPQKF